MSDHTDNDPVAAATRPVKYIETPDDGDTLDALIATLERDLETVTMRSDQTRALRDYVSALRTRRGVATRAHSDLRDFEAAVRRMIEASTSAMHGVSIGDDPVSPQLLEWLLAHGWQPPSHLTVATRDESFDTE